MSEAQEQRSDPVSDGSRSAFGRTARPRLVVLVLCLAVATGGLMGMPSVSSARALNKAVQGMVSSRLVRWSQTLVDAYHHDQPVRWSPPALGITQHGLRVVVLSLDVRAPGGTWALQDFLQERVSDGALLPRSVDSIAVHRIGAHGRTTYFGEVSADVASAHDHAWAISIEDLDLSKCGPLSSMAERYWCSQGPIMTTRRHDAYGERAMSVPQWQQVERQLNHEIASALRLAPIHGAVTPNLPTRFFAATKATAQ